MSKNFACSKLGMQCSFSAKANTEEELIRQVSQHAKGVHNLKFDKALESKARATFWNNG